MEDNNDLLEQEEFVPIKKNKSKKKVWPLVIFIVLVIISLLVAYIIINRHSGYILSLLGDKEVTINLDEEYTDKGCEVLDSNGYISIDKPTIKTNLDNKTPGTYYMICKYKDKSRTRYIHVKEKEDNDTVGAIDIYYEDGKRLSHKSNNDYVDETTIFTISLSREVDYIKYCIANYGEKCEPKDEARSLDTFTIHARGKKTIYIEKYRDDKMVKEVRYVNIK